MTQEEKSLLLQDLCERLPYGVVVHYKSLARPLFGIEPTQHFQIILDNALDGEHNGLVYVSLDVYGEEPKPYLRPMSSMTEEEKSYYEDRWFDGYHARGGDDMVSEPEIPSYIEWLNKNMFDYHGLIPMGLALEAPEGMYN